MREEEMPGAHAQRCFAAAWRAAEQMGWIVDDEVQHPFAVCLMVSLPTGYADRVVIAPEAELSTALRRPGRWVALHQDPPEACGVRLEVYGDVANWSCTPREARANDRYWWIPF
jgi:hypothetical protein